MSENTLEVRCPRCGQKTIYSTVNQFRPFCSECCKLIDLGDWATGKFAIPIPDTAEGDSNRIESTPEDKD